ncbi:RsmB/NOP family class I SAM-dependent RNA methyltransferase [Candidatus Woesearchaeota archaeon]|nr:RsmB/NOP family class I SAM-dependent RNA methyltransferase [Candidatus Woesearchaeota archaeon]
MVKLERIPNTENIKIKDSFKEQYKNLLGKDYDEFIKYSLSYQRKAIRVNTLKISIDDLKKRLEKRWILKQVPWCREGFFIDFKGTEEEKEDERYDIGNLPEHAMGYIYVQSAVSMIPPLVMELNPKHKVLDLCAAPGSKTTQIAQYMGNKGILIANDIDAKRLKALGLNLQRCGITNTIITNMSGNSFSRRPDKDDEKFDRILLDAPCSGTGIIMKSLKTLLNWNINAVKRLQSIQKDLIQNSFKILKKKGLLIYSTCTLEPMENEAVIDYFLKHNKNAKLEEIKLPIKSTKPFLEYNDEKYNKEIKKCLRIHPYDNNTGGFFVAKIRKL